MKHRSCNCGTVSGDVRKLPICGEFDASFPPSHSFLPPCIAKPLKRRANLSLRRHALALHTEATLRIGVNMHSTLRILSTTHLLASQVRRHTLNIQHRRPSPLPQVPHTPSPDVECRGPLLKFQHLPALICTHLRSLLIFMALPSLHDPPDHPSIQMTEASAPRLEGFAVLPTTSASENGAGGH